MFIARPSTLLKEFVASQGWNLDYDWGRMAMALEIVTQIKVLEEVKLMGDTARAQAVSALQTLLLDCGMESAYEVYDLIGNWRIKTFSAEPVPWQRGNVGVGDGTVSRDLERRSSSGPASDAAGLARRDRIRALPPGRRSPYEPPTSEPRGPTSS
jgi:hypothetical protein